MKVIDLLNKIANGEKINRFIFQGEEFYLEGDDVCYRCKETQSIFENRFILEQLNDEVKILDEEKKIPEKLPKSVTDNACSSEDMRLIANTLNQVIDYLESKEKGE